MERDPATDEFTRPASQHSANTQHGVSNLGLDHHGRHHFAAKQQQCHQGF